MINDLEQTMKLLAMILDMGHGSLPEDMFALTIVVRCKEEAVPAHFLIGDDDEPTVIATVKDIASRSAFIGKATEGGFEFGAKERGAVVAGDGPIHVQITDPEPVAVDIISTLKKVEAALIGYADQHQQAVMRVLAEEVRSVIDHLVISGFVEGQPETTS